MTARLVEGALRTKLPQAEMISNGSSTAERSTPRHLAAPPTFDQLYDQSFELVWRLLRRLGVAESSLDDAVQDVFLIVHRRMDEFERRSEARTWIAGIAIRVAADYRRHLRRKGGLEPLGGGQADPRSDPHLAAVQAEALRQLYQVLGELDDQRREVFVLAELEQLTAPEISRTLGLNVNTVYTRLRTARRVFDQALRRHER